MNSNDLPKHRQDRLKQHPLEARCLIDKDSCPVRLVAENSPIGACIAIDGHPIWANPALAAMLGVEPDEIPDALKWDPSRFIIPEDMPKVQKYLQNRPRGRAAREDLHVRARTREGCIVHLAITTRSVSWRGSEAMILTVTEKTETASPREPLAPAKAMPEHRGAERTTGLADPNERPRPGINAANCLQRHQKNAAAADAANRANSDFLSTMSHEIRTPLAGVVGMTELLRDTSLNEEQRDYVEKIRYSADALQTLASDILDYSKIEAGNLELIETSFLLRDCLSDVLVALAVDAQRKGLEMALRVDPSIPDELLGDPGRLRQVVYNLVGNAIKHTESGDVFLNVEPDGNATDRIDLCLNISDTGHGIPGDRISDIFEPFTQTDASRAWPINGNGLGLAISRSLAEIMGGHLDVESRVSVGSTFRLHMPFRLSTRHQKRPGITLPPSLELPVVLVVDDNPTQRRIIEEVITGWGMKPYVTDSPNAAWNAAEEARASGTIFQLILIDATLPQMDGFELARQFRDIAEFNNTRIVMLTNVGSRGDAIRCRELGLSGYLRKPLRESEMRQAIEKALNSSINGGPPPLVTRHTIREERRRLRVLLVEDNLINREVTVQVLDKYGHKTASVENGLECLNILKKEPFDLILMDIQMPVMDGLEACRRIREKERDDGGHLPIIAVTAQAMAGDRETCLRQGMDAYISKPFKARDLINVIETVMSPSHPDKASVAPTAALDQSGDGRDGEKDEKTVVFDREDAMVRVDGDAVLLAELSLIFMETAPRQMEAIHCGHQNGDMNALRQSAHALKGAAGSLSAWATYHKALELEQLAKANKTADIPSALAALEREIERLSPILQELARKAM